MADQELQEFMKRVLEELRKVEGAATPEASIYALSKSSRHVVVTDPIYPQHDIVKVEASYARHWTFSGVHKLDGLKLSGSAMHTLGMKSLGRRYTLPLKLQQLGADYETPWVGYNYTAMHASVVKFMADVVAERERQRTRDEYFAAHKARLLRAIKDTTHEVRDEGSTLHVPLGANHVRINSMNGKFRLEGFITAANAERALDALNTLFTALDGSDTKEEKTP